MIRSTIFTLLFVLFSTAHAADDMQDMQIDVDESPAGFMARLQEAEAASNIDERGEFNLLHVFKKPYTHTPKAKPQYMMTCFQDYSEYFRALAASTKLTDEQKLQKEFVLIPYFKNLANAPAAMYNTEINLMVEPGPYDTPADSLFYPYVRLFLSALTHVMDDVNLRDDAKNLLVMSLGRKDVSLTALLLRHGADPNMEAKPRCGTKGASLNHCKTLKEALLLVEAGANVCEQLKGIKGYFLIIHAIDKADAGTLNLLLQNITLNQSNIFGKNWMYRLAYKSWALELDNFSQKLSALLEIGCYCDEKDESRIRDYVSDNWLSYACGHYEDPKKAEKIKALFLQAFEKEKERNKNIVQHLRQRQQTGMSQRAFQAKAKPFPAYERTPKKKEAVGAMGI